MHARFDILQSRLDEQIIATNSIRSNAATKLNAMKAGFETLQISLTEQTGRIDSLESSLESLTKTGLVDIRVRIGNLQAGLDAIHRPRYSTPANYSELIIVTGPPRSGTTWLNREICNGKDMFSFLPECTLLTQQVELYSRTLHYSDPQRFHAFFTNKQNLLAYYRDSVIKLINQVAELNQKPDATILVLKDPGLSLHLDEVKELFPPHKLVVLVRDPRDVMASMKNVALRKQKSWDVQDAAAQLFSYYHHIGNYQADQDTLFVRYEDLVAGDVSALQDFLHQPVLQNTFRNSDVAAVRNQLDTADPFFSELYLQPTTGKMVGSYHEILSDDEVRHIETVYSGVIEHWGY